LQVQCAVRGFARGLSGEWGGRRRGYAIDCNLKFYFQANSKHSIQSLGKVVATVTTKTLVSET